MDVVKFTSDRWPQRAITVEDDCGIGEAKNGWSPPADDSPDLRAHPQQRWFSGSAHAIFLGGVAKRRTDNYLIERVNYV
jgi:hypothetical protein